MGGASGIIGGMGGSASVSAVTQAGIYTAAGMGAGAINAGISNANIMQGALVGGAFGLASYLAPVPSFEPFGESAIGSIGNRVFNSSLTGSVFGATYAGVTGGDIGQGAAMGALGWAAGEGVNMFLGHAVGFIGSGFQKPAYANGEFLYDAQDWGGWITFSNVITGPATSINDTLIVNGQEVYGRTYFDHELGHSSPQGTLLGPAYVPLHAASMGIGGVVGALTGNGFVNGTHRFGLLERYWHPVPAGW